MALVPAIAGEHASDLPAKDEKANVDIGERFTGSFRRVGTLPEDADPDKISARYRDGMLHISATGC